MASGKKAIQKSKISASDMTLFKKEVNRLKKEFDAKIESILNEIKEEKLKQIKKRIQS